MATKAYISLITLGLALGGCQQAQPPVANDMDRVITVAEFKDDAALRARVLALCSNNPGEYRKAPNCVNVKQSERALSSGSGDFPRIDLTQK